MSIRAAILDEQALILIYASGQTRFSDLQSVNDQSDTEPRYRQYNELIVVQDANAISTTGETDQYAEEMARKLGPDSHYLTAFIVNSPLDFGLIRRFASLRDRDQQSIQVFTELDPAMDFVGINDMVNRQDCRHRFQLFADRFDESLWF